MHELSQLPMQILTSTLLLGPSVRTVNNTLQFLVPANSTPYIVYVDPVTNSESTPVLLTTAHDLNALEARLEAQTSTMIALLAENISATAILTKTLAVQLNASFGAALSGETSFARAINEKETERASGVEISLAESLYAERTRATTIENSLANSVAAETQRARMAEDMEASRAMIQDDSIATSMINALRQETSRAMAAEESSSWAEAQALVTEVSLGKAISTEQLRAVEVEQSLGLQISIVHDEVEANASRSLGLIIAEVLRAEGVERSLAGAAAEEISQTGAVQSSLAASVADERTRASGQEASVLREAVDNATSMALATVHSQIALETARAAGTENSLAGALAEENLRALQAEGALSAAVAQEEARAQHVEASLALALALSPLSGSIGGTITLIGGYRIHTFTQSGSFTASGDGTVELLVVGGGGGAGYDLGGGGGGGGIAYSASYPVQAGVPVTVAVGAGGINAQADGVKGSSGSNSAFGSVVAYGGGGGGSVRVEGGETL